MTDYIQGLLAYYVVEKQHHQFRRDYPAGYGLAQGFAAQKLSDTHRATARLRWMLEKEQPVVFKDEKITMMRTVTRVPEIHTKEEFARIQSRYTIHEQGKVCNINPSYSMLLDVGTRKKRGEVLRQIGALPPSGSAQQLEFLQALLAVLEAVEAFAEKYRQKALEVGNLGVARVLGRIPQEKPQTFVEALQYLRLLHYCMWCGFNYHNTLGRFDQYMYPYYAADIQSGLLTPESALELLEEFFISCNKDSDLYPGIQQGDNGQSMVLGGLNPDGSESYNALSDLCMQASLELKLIDPKINLRVNKNTPLSLYEKGSMLTKQGLGFPQYANDDIVVQALKQWGYADKDAYNYVVAACWEFIVPGAGMDIPNIGGLSFTHAVAGVLGRANEWANFEQLMACVKEEIFSGAQELMEATRNIYMEPAPLISLMMEGCVEKGQDISLGGHYNNYGLHGTGLSTAVDSLAAMRKYIFDENLFAKEDLQRMLDENFENNDELYSILRYQAPKMGNDDADVDAIATQLLDWFADALEGHLNSRGGIFRPGTGSAMYYIWHAKEEPATPDGRKKGEALACNYSPSLFSRCNGPVSILKSFAKPNLVRVANGGPLTIELHDNMFRNASSTRKVAQYVKSFMDMGGHQMQINAVNRDKMKDAKKHPENYPNLIVRVWGWSGYFVELDEVYQDHIIERMELSV